MNRNIIGLIKGYIHCWHVGAHGAANVYSNALAATVIKADTKLSKNVRNRDLTKLYGGK